MENKLTADEINILGNIINTTFGKSSVNETGYSVTTTLHGDKMTLKYMTVFNTNDSDGIRLQKKANEKRSNEMLNKSLKNIKKEFKEKAGRSVNFKELENSDSLEAISMQAHRKRFYYRREIIFEVK